MINESADSGYIENLKLIVFSKSQEIPIIIEDINRQLYNTIELSTKIGLAKLNGFKAHNESLLENLNRFEELLDKQILGHNIPIYLRDLVKLRIAISKLNEIGLEKWKEIFPFSYNLETDKKISKYFQEDVDKLIDDLRLSFKSKLLLSNEKSELEKQQPF